MILLYGPVITLSLLAQALVAYQPSSRRKFLSVVPATLFSPAAASASKYCASGVGDGCSDLAEGNEFIMTLQERSAANKEKYEQEARDAYFVKNYPDWFASIGKAMVKKSDGTFFTVTEQELLDLKAANKIKLEYPKAMGGKVTDLTQKPILVLAD